MVDSIHVTASGLPSHEEQKIGFPSGAFDLPIEAFLSSFNATFGFNNNPHGFDLEYVPGDPDQLAAFQESRLPAIGSGVAFFAAGDFFIKGRIIHADYNKAINGNVLSIRIEDTRTDIDDFVIDTYGVFGSNDAPTESVVDVRYWFVQTRIKTLPQTGPLRDAGRSRAFKDLNQLETQGASYRQIYEAVQFFEQNVGTITGLVDAIPLPEVVESQLPEDPDAYRWKFKAQPFLQALSKILSDISYDFYWIMSEDRIGVINRKFPVNISETEIPISGDPAETISQRFGQDEGERPTTVRLLGAEMEGVVGCGDFKVESGAYGFGVPIGGTGVALEYDLGISVCESTDLGRVLNFIPGWRNAILKFFGPDGSLREIRPTDRQLAAALKGIEYWATEVQLDNRITTFTIQDLSSETERQVINTAASGRLGRIPNRLQTDRAWIVEWYNRMRTFAQNHFARTYVLSKDTPLYDFIDEINVLPEAWSNLENQTDDGSFKDDYEVSDRFKFLSPFWNRQTNKLKAFATVSFGTKWGQDGTGTPAQFDKFNETPEGDQLVPIEVSQWNRANDKFKEEFLEPLREDEKGIMIRLPNHAWEKQVVDDTLAGIPNLVSMKDLFNGDTTFDIVDPLEYLTPFTVLPSSIGLPLRTKRRFGLKFPEVWASGTGVKRETIIREDLAPWNFEPRGLKNSFQLMNDEARSALASRVVNRNAVTFAETSKIGLPVISFDSFANQVEKSQGYGVVTHGVTNLNMTYSVSTNWQTKYSLKSHFAQLIKARPVFDGPEEDFNFIFRRLEEDIRNKLPPDIFQPPEIFDPKLDAGKEVFQVENPDKFEITVTIQTVFDRGADEFYRGVDDRNIQWPRALDSGINLDESSQAFINRKAFAVDGFLQQGMTAIYHYEEQEDGSFVHYFTGGVALAESRVVALRARDGNVVRTVASESEQIFVSDIETLSTEVIDTNGDIQTVPPFILFDVPFIAQNAVDENLSAGVQLVMTTHGNKDGKAIAPDANVGPLSESNNFNDAFLVNTAGTGTEVDFAEVTVAPDATSGTGGTVQSVTSAAGTSFADGAANGAGGVFIVRFVGADNDQIKVSDQAMIKQFTEAGSSDTRIFCFVVKPKLAGTDAFSP